MTSETQPYGEKTPATIATEPERSASKVRVIEDLERKTPGQTVVAHLSDLHLLASTSLDDEVWAPLCQDLSERKGTIDVLAFTGDLIDCAAGDFFRRRVPMALDKARTLVERAASCAGVRPEAVFVIPGNHDARPKGFLPIRLVGRFTAAFPGWATPAFFPGLSLFVYPFDSNEPLWFADLASGYVRPSELSRFRETVEEVRHSCKSEWDSSTRIALLHHHAMPIPAAERRKIDNFEEFLLLRNAGTFMSEMLHNRMDVILHGHKHCPSTSSASFLDEGIARTITVVAGGSAGGVVEHPVYNILTTHDGGRIELERRIRRTANYSEDETITLRTYQEGRRIRYERLKSQGRPLVRVAKYSHVATIEAGSGDARSVVTFDGVRAVSEEPIDRLPVTVSSSTGYFGAPVHEPDSIGWQWDGPAVDGRRRGCALFDPAIGDQPVSFVRTIRMANAFHFSRRDLQDATGRDRSEEDMHYATIDVVDRMALAVVFPDGYFPTRVRIRVIDRRRSVDGDEEVRDREEERHCASGLSVFEASRSVVFTLDAPLPGLRYAIVWDLPADDPKEPRLTEVQASFATEAADRLRAAGDQGNASHPAVSEALRALHGEVMSALTTVIPGAKQEALEISLYGYDTEKQGLRCLLSTIADPADPILSAVVKPGQQTVGQAYRRRQALLSTSSALYEEGQPSHTAIFALPLFYPSVNGQRIAVVSLSSKSNLTPLLRLADDPALADALRNLLREWSNTQLMHALELSEFQQ